MSSASEIELGTSKEVIEELLGQATTETKLKSHNGVFLNLYYQSINTNYVLDLSNNTVCEIGTGSSPSTCYPCSGKNGQDLCI